MKFLLSLEKRFLFFTDKPTKTDIKLSRDSVMFGNQVTITCSSNGQPKPLLFIIIHNGTIHITGIKNTYTKQVNLDDAGNYTCVAVNKLGSNQSDTQLLNVTVKGKFSCKDVCSLSILSTQGHKTCTYTVYFRKIFAWKRVRISSLLFRRASSGRKISSLNFPPLS